MINEILEFNRAFVTEGQFTSYTTSKYPNKKLAILSCMDTRLTKLLPAALGLENGDAKIIQNAGGVISHPYGSVVRSLIIAVYELGVTDIMVIGHTDCGVKHLDTPQLIDTMIHRGISAHDIEILRSSGINFDTWLGGFENLHDSVQNSVDCLIKHPLIPSDVSIHGFIIDSTTGELTMI